MMLKTLLMPPLKFLLLLMLKDKHVLPILLMPDQDLNKLRTIKELPNGILKNLSLLFINHKPERKLLTEPQLWPLLKDQPDLMELKQLSNHSVDGKRIPHTLETSSSKLPRTSDHAMLDHHIQDLPVQPKSLIFQSVLLLFQLVNKSHSVTVLVD